MDSMDALIIVFFIGIFVVYYVIRYFLNKGFNTLGDVLDNKVVDWERDKYDGYSVPIRLAERYPDVAESAANHGICPKPLGGYETIVPDSTFESEDSQQTQPADSVKTVKKVTVYKVSHCPGCGSPYRVGQSFCANCGTSLNNS